MAMLLIIKKESMELDIKIKINRIPMLHILLLENGIDSALPKHASLSGLLLPCPLSLSVYSFFELGGLRSLIQIVSLSCTNTSGCVPAL